MAKEAFYIISSCDPETYSPIIVKGPEVENWEKYCKELIPEVIKMAIKICSKGEVNAYGHINTFNWTISEIYLAEAMVLVLKEKGYEDIKFPEWSFGWHDSEKYDEIVEFNLITHLENNKNMMEDDKTDENFIKLLEEENERLKEMLKEVREKIKKTRQCIPLPHKS
jgi:hypothetical protein